MANWNPFRALSGIEQGLKVRKEYGEKKRLREGRATSYFSAVAGREPTYRFFLQDNRENVNSIESLEEAVDRAAEVNRGRLNERELSELRRLSPSGAVERFRHINAEELATLYLLIGRIQALTRQGIRPDPLQTITDAMTAYYQQLPTSDSRRLRPGEHWRYGDPHRPYLQQVFERYRRR